MSIDIEEDLPGVDDLAALVESGAPVLEESPFVAPVGDGVDLSAEAAALAAEAAAVRALDSGPLTPPPSVQPRPEVAALPSDPLDELPTPPLDAPWGGILAPGEPLAEPVPPDIELIAEPPPSTGPAPETAARLFTGDEPPPFDGATGPSSHPPADAPPHPDSDAPFAAAAGTGDPPPEIEAARPDAGMAAPSDTLSIDELPTPPLMRVPLDTPFLAPPPAGPPAAEEPAGFDADGSGMQLPVHAAPGDHHGPTGNGPVPVEDQTGRPPDAGAGASVAPVIEPDTTAADGPFVDVDEHVELVDSSADAVEISAVAPEPPGAASEVSAPPQSGDSGEAGVDSTGAGQTPGKSLRVPTLKNATPPPIPGVVARSTTDQKASGSPSAAETPAAAAAPLPILPEALAQRPRRPKRSKPWFEEVFDEDYLRTLPFMSAAQTLREVEFISEALQPRPGAELLDVACGYGRHAIELVQRGVAVTGLDLSLPLLIRAADEAQRRGLAVNFVHADMREMAFERQFDGAYCMLTSFGYFDEENNLRVAERIARSLKPGARFLLDVINRDYVVADLPTRLWWEGKGCVVLEEVDFNFNTSRLITHRSIVFEDGRQLEQEISVRIYGLHEIGRLLRQAGFRVIEVSGGLATPGQFLGASSRNLLVVCEKPENSESGPTESGSPPAAPTQNVS